MDASNAKEKPRGLRWPRRIARISWRDLALAAGPIVLIGLLGLWAAIHYVRPAPPDTIVMTTGADGSTFRRFAERYRTILARHGVKLEILRSEGSVENLKRLADPAFNVDVGFVQGGVVTGDVDISNLVSLGSVAYEPLIVFYRGATIGRLSELAGRRIAIGGAGSGTRALALTLLKANGITASGTTRLLPLSGEQAVNAMLKHEIDAAFLMGDSASPANMGKLLRTPGIRLFDFVQADAYVRRFRYLSKLELPPGAIDLGKNLPRKRLSLIAPTIELIARQDLHPALSDLLIEAAREVHGSANLIQKAHEFPAPLAHEFPISSDAARYYKSGKSFAYRYLPFWIASLVDRTVLVLIPIIVLLIPGMRLVPMLYGWRIRSRIFRRYADLMTLERQMMVQPLTPERQAELRKRLGDIERAVINAKIPGSYADEVYVLRRHIKLVRDGLTAEALEAERPSPAAS